MQIFEKGRAQPPPAGRPGGKERPIRQGGRQIQRQGVDVGGARGENTGTT